MLPPLLPFFVLPFSTKFPRKVFILHQIPSQGRRLHSLLGPSSSSLRSPPFAQHPPPIAVVAAGRTAPSPLAPGKVAGLQPPSSPSSPARGKGIPILGKSKMLLGLLEGIPTMFKGEIAVLKMKPEMHYGEEDCPVSVSDSFPKEAELHFEIELIEFSEVKVVSSDLGVLKKVLEGQSWESPREPYEVKAQISAKSGAGKVILSHTQGEPYSFTSGKSEEAAAYSRTWKGHLQNLLRYFEGEATSSCIQWQSDDGALF